MLAIVDYASRIIYAGIILWSLLAYLIVAYYLIRNLLRYAGDLIRYSYLNDWKSLKVVLKKNPLTYVHHYHKVPRDPRLE